MAGLCQSCRAECGSINSAIDCIRKDTDGDFRVRWLAV